MAGEPRLARRALRAIALISTAVLAIAVAGALELRSSAPAPRQIGLSSPVELASASFGDAEHGAVTVLARRHGGTYLTADGGRTWRASTVENVVFSDPRHAIAIRPGSAPRRVLTSDAGRTWTAADGLASTDVVVGAPFFLDPGDGWLLSSEARPQPENGPLLRLWRSSDGGRSWTRLRGDGIPPPAAAGAPVFQDASRGAMIVAATGLGGGVALLLTRNGGESWSPGTLPPPPLPDGARFFADLHLVGGRLLAWYDVVEVPAERSGPTRVTSYTAVSDDGGLTWRAPASGPFVLEPPMVGFIGGRLDDGSRLLQLDDRRLWVSDDLGASWYARVAEVPAAFRPIGLVGGRGALYAVALRTDGPLGTGLPQALLRSDDGGAHWAEVRLPAAG